MTETRSGLGQTFERLSTRATLWAGSTSVLVAAIVMIVIWLLTGPVFHFSDTWQLVMNTVTSIVTFIMVFLIQRTQNKDALAVQLKLNELVAALEGASNRLIDIEELSEADLRVLHEYYQRLTDMAKKDEDLGRSHSVEEAQQRHAVKHMVRQKAGKTAAG